MASLYKRKDSPYIWLRYYDKHETEPHKKRKSVSTKLLNNKKGWKKARELKKRIEAAQVQNELLNRSGIDVSSEAFLRGELASKSDLEILQKNFSELLKTLFETKTMQENSDKIIKHSNTKRLLLTPSEMESLNSKIVEKVNDFIDSGKGTQEQAFIKLSINSKKIFNYSLTKGAVEGRYKRRPGKDKRTPYK